MRSQVFSAAVHISCYIHTVSLCSVIVIQFLFFMEFLYPRKFSDKNKKIIPL